MCGICGYISKKLISAEELSAMNDTMIHRGPNDNGVELYEGKNGYNVGFAHRRLSIMDLSPLGHQPMHSNDKRVSVVFNGEIYNYGELKAELSEYAFKSNCDTEVILAAYLRWGIDMVRHLNGMYAIALFDRQSGKVFLIRDRIGKKPLCYWNTEDGIVFASELKPIMKCSFFNEKINKSVLSRYLFQQYINAPYTVFENVYKLEPGSYLEFDNGEISLHKYWNIADVYKENAANPVSSYEEAKEVLKDKLRDSVSRRMIADVPVGTFLSGGYDSSLVTAIASEISEGEVKSFSIGFEEPEYNEAVYAGEIAKHLGTKHTEEYINTDTMFRMIEDMPRFFDEPFADDSQIATMLVCKLAKQDVTVTLSGDGGDEFFCGYNTYDRLPLAKKLDGIGAVLNGIDKSGFGKAVKLHDRFNTKVKAIVSNRDIRTKTQMSAEGYEQVSRAFVKDFDESEYKSQSFDFINEISGIHEDLEKGMLMCKYPYELSYSPSNWQIKRMLLDMDTYLPSDILLKVDHAAMKYSLESRCPIMDLDIMEYSFRLPHEFKYKDGVKKRILKDIAYDYIPKEMLERPKKGFSVPIDMWLRGPLKDKLLDYCSEDFLNQQGLFDTEYVSKFIADYLITGDKGQGSGENYSRIVWSFFAFQQWYETYMK